MRKGLSEADEGAGRGTLIRRRRKVLPGIAIYAGALHASPAFLAADDVLLDVARQAGTDEVGKTIAVDVHERAVPDRRSVSEEGGLGVSARRHVHSGIGHRRCGQRSPVATDDCWEK